MGAVNSGVSLASYKLVAPIANSEVGDPLFPRRKSEKVTAALTGAQRRARADGSVGTARVDRLRRRQNESRVQTPLGHSRAPRTAL